MTSFQRWIYCRYVRIFLASPQYSFTEYFDTAEEPIQNA